jgi:FtsZ-binding cell division protein ZapB
MEKPVPEGDQVKSLNQKYKDLNLIEQATPSYDYLHSRGLKPGLFKSFCKYKRTNNGAELVLPITNNQGEVIATQTINLNSDGKKEPFPNSNGTTPLYKKYNGAKKGGSFKMGPKPREILHIGEGPESSMSIFQVTRETTWSALDAGNLKSLEIPHWIQIVHIWADKDSNLVGQKAATQLALRLLKEGKVVFLHIPTGKIKEGQKSLDYNDILQKNANQIKKQYENDLPFSIKDIFGEIKELGVNSISKPLNFIPKQFPKVISDYCFPIAKSIGGPPEYILCPLLSALSLIVSDIAILQPKERDTSWRISPNLFSMIIGSPSAKKTPLMNMAISLFTEIEKEENKKIESKKHFLQVQWVQLEAEITKLEKSISKKSEPCDFLQMELQELYEKKEELIQQQSPERLVSNQFTIEKLIDNLSRKNGKGMVLYRDELSGLFNLIWKRGNEGWEAFLTEAWNGIGSFTHETKSGGVITVSPLILSIIGAIQPEKLKSFLFGSYNLMDSGFINRFQLMVYPEHEDSFGSYKDETIEESHKLPMSQLIRKIFEFSKKIESKLVFTFEKDAQIKFIKIYNEINQLARKESNEKIESHFAKYHKLVTSLALIFEVIEQFSFGSSLKPTVTINSLNKAWGLTKSLHSHALKIFNSNDDSEQEAPYLLLEKIRQGEVTNEITVRDLARKKWRGLTVKSTLLEGLKKLEEHNYIRIIDKPKVSNLGQKSKQVIINPSLLVQ